MASLSASPSGRRLSELLEEKQEPFYLDLHLLEKGCSPRLLDGYDTAAAAAVMCWPAAAAAGGGNDAAASVLRRLTTTTTKKKKEAAARGAGKKTTKKPAAAAAAATGLLRRRRRARPAAAYWEAHRAELTRVSAMVASEVPSSSRIGAADVRPERDGVGADLEAAVLDQLLHELAVELAGGR
uniref:Uncharacterized protein n=1 Tax=Oryza barthii TaxID=65489 RepID=A0A0D3HMZ9_9ORYZ